MGTWTLIIVAITCCCDVLSEDQAQVHSTDPSPWKLCTDSPPSNPKFYPTLGNGHIATVVHSDSIFMNGFYNGNGTDSARARIPGLLSINISKISEPIRNATYCLHMDTGLYIEKFIGDHWQVEVRMFAHRTLTRLLVAEMRVETDGKHPLLKIDMSLNYGNQSEDANFVNSTSDVQKAMYMSGTNNIPETPHTERVRTHIYYTPPLSHIVIQPGQARSVAFPFMVAISPIKNEAKEAYLKGQQLFKDQTLESSHVKAWNATWRRGRIDIKDNNHLASITHSALYYILSATPTIQEVTWPFIGLSPGDLAHGNGDQDYMGHVFWDQDTWMFPPILVLHADIGRTIVNTRIRTLDGSKKYAKQRGFQGAMYTWESAYTGLDVTPSWECSEYEVHVTGDVAFAFRQYLMMTRDVEILRHGRLKEAVYDIADFWMSRVTLNDSTGLYDISGVMPPDEHHFPVNNSVYTNSIARLSLRLPDYVSSLLGEAPPTKYENVASKIVLLLDEAKQYHPEYEGYTTDIDVKQADVILLGFPLGVNMTREQRKNDLYIYQKRTPGGPAMSWSMFGIGWLELGDMEQAKVAFLKQMLNNQPPFNVWTEEADGTGATNFITGQGGYLQSLLFGYAGLRLHIDKITLQCKPLPDITSFTIVGLDYLNNSLEVTCVDTSITITLKEAGVSLFIGKIGDARKIPLIPDTPEQYQDVGIEITSDVLCSTTANSPPTDTVNANCLPSTFCLGAIAVFIGAALLNWKHIHYVYIVTPMFLIIISLAYFL